MQSAEIKVASLQALERGTAMRECQEQVKPSLDSGTDAPFAQHTNLKNLSWDLNDKLLIL